MTEQKQIPQKPAAKHYSPEVRSRAVRMVLEHRGEHTSEWAAIGSIAAKIGCTAETLRSWVRQAQRDQGQRPARPRTSASGSARWSGRFANCAKPTRSCARHQRILRWRSSTADPGYDRLHRRSSRRLRGRADLQDSADRPVHLSRLCRAAIRSCPASARARRDTLLRAKIRRVWEENYRVYGVRKVWRQLRREAVEVARCTVARLMAEMGLHGAVRGKSIRTTTSDRATPCPADRVNRQFQAPRPNTLWVSDFTYVATWQG